MTHPHERIPFNAASRAAEIRRMVPPLEENVFGIDIFGPSVAARRAQTARLATAGSQLDRERTGNLISAFRAAIQQKLADDIPLGVAVNQAVVENPEFLLDKDLFSSVEALRSGLQLNTITAGRGDRVVGTDPGSGRTSTISGSEPRPLIPSPAGTQLQDPVTGQNVGPQVPFKEPLPPADERMVNAIQAARRSGDEERVRLLTQALLKDNSTNMIKEVAEVFKLEAKADELRKTPGKEREAESLDAQAKLLKETIKGRANFLADFFAGRAPGGGAPAPSVPLATGGPQGNAGADILRGAPPGPVVPLAGGTPPPAAPTGGLTPSDQQILALPLAQIEEQQLVALLSRPAGIEAFRAKLAQERLQAVPGGGPTVPGTTGAIAPGPVLGVPGAP